MQTQLHVGLHIYPSQQNYMYIVHCTVPAGSCCEHLSAKALTAGSLAPLTCGSISWLSFQPLLSAPQFFPHLCEQAMYNEKGDS